jgi:hypothetical protein
MKLTRLAEVIVQLYNHPPGRGIETREGPRGISDHGVVWPHNSDYEFQAVSA